MAVGYGGNVGDELLGTIQVNVTGWQKDSGNKSTTEGRKAKAEMNRKEETTVKLLRFQGDI